MTAHIEDGELDSELFSIDPQPCAELNSKKEDTRNHATPDVYRVYFAGQLGKEVDTPSPRRRMFGKCFNCGESGHSVEACKASRNARNIRRNRSIMNLGKAMREGTKHQAGEFSITVGKPSEKLLEAVGIGAKEIPPWIYNMRVLGYPPGYLRSAVDSLFQLEFFDGDDESPSSPSHTETLGLSDVVEFPGFNVEPPKGTRDEGGRGRLLPMSRNHNKARLLELLNRELSEKREEQAEMKMKRTLSTPAKLESSFGANLPPPPPPPEIPLEQEPSSHEDSFGHSLNFQHGTALIINTDTKTPDFDAFAKDIEEYQPVEDNPEDPTTRRGNFQRIRNLVKKYRSE